MAGRDRSFLLNALQHSQSKRSEEFSIPVCICSRPIQDVLCQACGFVFTGRARKQCSLHPMAIHLMDSGNCPRCKNTYLHEFRPSKTALCRNPNELVNSDNENNNNSDMIHKWQTKLGTPQSNIPTGANRLANKTIGLGKSKEGRDAERADLELGERR